MAPRTRSVSVWCGEKDNIWLQPRQSRRVRVRIEGTLDQTQRSWAFFPEGKQLARYPNILFPGVCFENVAEQEERETEGYLGNGTVLTLQVLNVGEKSVCLPAGLTVGKVYPLEESMILDSVALEKSEDVFDEIEDELAGGREPDIEPPTVGVLRKKVAELRHLSEKQREQVFELLVRNQGLFALNPNAPGGARVAPHMIEEVPGSKPVFTHGYRLNPKKAAELEKQVKGKLEAGLVVPIKSPYSSPVVLVQKPDGSYRFTCDYRKINAQTIADKMPLPRIDDLLAQLGGNMYFSCLDLSSGFFQIPLHEDSIKKTAFATPSGLYAWTRMPQGLTSSPATFQRAMATFLSGLTGTQACVYLDDIIVMGKDFESHLGSLEEVFNRLRTDGFSLKLKKCHFFQEEAVYLGHVVSRKGRKPLRKNVDTVKDFPVPHGSDKQKVQQTQAFIGLANYYSAYIQDFESKREPLVRLTKKGVCFVWGEEQQEAFDQLKLDLTSYPLLRHPDFSRIHIRNRRQF